MRKKCFMSSKLYPYIIMPIIIISATLIAGLTTHPKSRQGVFDMMRGENVAYHQIEDDVMFFAVYTGRITGWGDRRYDVLIFSRSTILPRYRLIFEFSDTLAHSALSHASIPGGWHNYRVDTTQRPTVTITSLGIRPPRLNIVLGWLTLIISYFAALSARKRRIMKK